MLRLPWGETAPPPSRERFGSSRRESETAGPMSSRLYQNSTNATNSTQNRLATCGSAATIMGKFRLITGRNHRFATAICWTRSILGRGSEPGSNQLEDVNCIVTALFSIRSWCTCQIRNSRHRGDGAPTSVQVFHSSYRWARKKPWFFLSSDEKCCRTYPNGPDTTSTSSRANHLAMGRLRSDTNSSCDRPLVVKFPK